jgi:diamine N-acetyltransferase
MTRLALPVEVSPVSPPASSNAWPPATKAWTVSTSKRWKSYSWPWPSHGLTSYRLASGSDAVGYRFTVIDYQKTDRQGRTISLRDIGDDWRAVADVAPLDEQREFVAPLAARYLLLSDRGGVWRSLAIYANEAVVGHVMWAVDDDDSHWIGGFVVDGSEQGAGIGRAAMETMLTWLTEKPACQVIRLSYQPSNRAAEKLYQSLGFVPTGEMDDGETVVEMKGLRRPEG